MALRGIAPARAARRGCPVGGALAGPVDLDFYCLLGHRSLADVVAGSNCHTRGGSSDLVKAPTKRNYRPMTAQEPTPNVVSPPRSRIQATSFEAAENSRRRRKS